MAAFGFWADDSTSTISYGQASYLYGPVIRAVTEPLLSMRAWARICLAAVRVLPTPKVWRPLEFAWSSPARAPRRTVVPRGLTSWIRAGTRRPL